LTTSFVFTVPDELDLSTVGAGFVRTAFIVRLPFRVRTGQLFKLTMDSGFEVVSRNKIDIPHGTTLDAMQKLMWIDKRIRPREEFYTEAMIIDRTPRVDEATAKRIVDWLQKEGTDAMPGHEYRYFDSLTSLNDAIVAYHSATGLLFGGKVVERLTNNQYFEHLCYVHTVLAPPACRFTDQDILQIFDARAEREFIQVGGQFTLELADVPTSQLDAIGNYLPLHRRFLFYQFALDAKTKMVEQDSVSAILFAAVALEGAHAVLLQLCLGNRLAGQVSDEDKRAKLAEQKANKLLLEVGFSEMVEMTSLFFLEETDRPKLTDVEACKLGISIRNEIMHALAKKGQHKLRNRTNSQISTAYSNMLTLYDHFIKIIEHTVNQPQQANGTHPVE
jgi:hypothetical protein